MKLWFLKQSAYNGYDTYDAFVVRAETALQARALASASAGDEGAAAWLTASCCVELSAEGPADIVLGSFNAG